MKQFIDILKSLLTFRFAAVAGIVMGVWLHLIQSELTPISSFLVSPRIYVISFLVVLIFHLTLWVIVEKASFYDIAKLLKSIVRDIVIINAVMLSTIAALFLFKTFAS